MSKKNKKNLKKIQAKIGNTPAKAEAAKKEESKSANTIKNIEARRKADEEKAKHNTELKAAKKAAKKANEEKKYAASKARIEARNARKKSIMDKLIDSKKIKASEPTKITLEQRKERQENRRKIAEARHITSIKRRCKRMKLDESTTNKVVSAAKKQWDSATKYNVVIVFDEIIKKRKEIEKIVKDCSIKTACITNSTAFLKDVPKSAIEKLRELIGNAVFYQYRADEVNPFEVAGISISKPKIKKPKKGGAPHSVECSKIHKINFYNLRRIKKAIKEEKEKNTYEFRHGSKAEGRKARRILRNTAKPVNKKPTQVKEIKTKSNNKAA